MAEAPDAWEAAATLHDEAHERGAFPLCLRPTCVALKDALVPDWRENRPGFDGPSYRDYPWQPGHDCDCDCVYF